MKSNMKKWKLHRSVWLFVTPWTIVCQAPLSMGFSKKNTEVGWHSLLQGDLPYPGIKTRSPVFQKDS